MDLKNKISFTTTALLRPDILESTYKSFSKNIKENLKELDLYLNLDPVPSYNEELVNKSLDIAKKYFDNVYYRAPFKPNFASAVKWVWAEISTDFIFNLEDDWLLKKSISLEKALKMFDKNIYQIIFPAYPYTYDKMALSPSIIKSEVCKKFAKGMVEGINPEVQLRDKKILNIKSSNVKAYAKDILVKDIGREWSKNKGLKKPKKHDFIRY